MSTTTKDPSSAELLNETRTTFSPSHESPKKGTAFGGADDVPCLETFHERRMRRKSHYVIYITTFIMSIGFSIILTGVWPYLKKLDPSASKEFLGWVVAANPLGQMIFSPILGWYANRVGSNRSAFVVTICFSIVGNIMYALLPMVQGYGAVRAVVLASRFIVGVSGANVAICRSYIVSSTKLKERTAALSATAAAQAIGFILGPSIQTGLVFLMDSGSDTSLSSTNGTDTLLPTDPFDAVQVYAVAGYFAAGMSVLNLLLFIPCIFQEYNLAEREVRMTSRQNSERTFDQKVDFPAIVIILFQTFMLVLVFVLIETLIVPMCMDIYAWSSTYAVTVVGIALTVSGTLSTVMFLLTGPLSKRFDERKVYIILGLIPMALSMLLFIPVGNTYPKIKYCNSTEALTTTLSPVTTPVYVHQNESFSRVTRAAVLDNDCDELGCPASQEWCFYTPVIALPQLAVACLCTAVGYPMSLALANGIFSKMLGFKPQGFWMGVLSSVMSFSRVVGPIFVTYMYTLHGLRWTFGILFCLMVFVLITCLLFFKRLKAMEILKEDRELDVVLTKVQQNGSH